MEWTTYETMLLSEPAFAELWDNDEDAFWDSFSEAEDSV